MSLQHLLRRRVLPVLLVVVVLLAAFAARGFWVIRADRPADHTATHSAIDGLASPSALDRANAVKTLHVLRDPAAVPALIGQLDDPDQAVGLYVAQALGDLAGPADLNALRSALRSTNPDVRWRAALALGQLNDAKAVDGLVVLLRDPDVLVQRTAADALAQIGDRGAAEALAGALGTPQESANRVAMAALERLGEDAVQPLTLALDSSNALARQNAATVLGYIGSPAAKPALQLAEVDPMPAVRAEAQWALAEIERGAAD
jgi:HEAT repeat protein